MYNIFKCLIIVILINYSICSAGDHSPYYQRCLEKCSLLNCTDDGVGFKNYDQPTVLYLTQWSCGDECRYNCMWKTVDAFHERKWRTPQFHGKWPFVRILGMQEPASVVFSILNGYVHLKMVRKFRAEVRPDSPLTWLWHTFFVVRIHILSQNLYGAPHGRTFTAICWFGWCTYNRIRQRYVWKCAIYVALTGIVMMLEIIDRPPFFYIFDYHSLWHLSTAPLIILIYSFAIDDCRYLRKKEIESPENGKSKVP
nr:post-GPI attachment to proteins factor 3 [Leptinotarsa decemlineata]